MKTFSISPLGYILPEALKEQYKNLYEVQAVGQGYEGIIRYDKEKDLIYFGSFNKMFDKLNLAKQIQLEQELTDFFKKQVF